MHLFEFRVCYKYSCNPDLLNRIDFGFVFQIDPSILQQTLQQSNILAQQLTGDPNMAPQNPSLQTTENAVPANVVIQPISGLSLQPTVTSSANMTIGSLSEQESVLTTSASGKWCH